MARQSTNRGGDDRKAQKRSWQQTVFIVLSILLIISWIAALLVTL